MNPETVKLNPDLYTDKHWHSQPRGASNGQLGGIKLLLDVDSYDFSYTGKESVGFRLVFSDVRDKPMMRQDGYLISPGKNKQFSKSVFQSIFLGNFKLHFSSRAIHIGSSSPCNCKHFRECHVSFYSR